MKIFFENPRRVVFATEENGVIKRQTGIAFRETVVCLDCGTALDVEDLMIEEVLPWISMSQEAVGVEMSGTDLR